MELNLDNLDSIITVGSGLIGLIGNTYLGYKKTGKLDLQSVLGIFLFFKNNVKPIIDRYEDQPIKDSKPVETILEGKSTEIIVGPTKEESKPKSRYKEFLSNIKTLNLVYNPQTDNKKSPNSACNVTSVQTALSLDLTITDDELFDLCNSQKTREIIQKAYPKDWGWIKPYFDKQKANEVLVVLLSVVQDLIGTQYTTIDWKLTFDKIQSEIDLGYAVPILGGFTSSSKYSHFVCIVGYDLVKECFIVHDPWGDWNKKYRGEGGKDGAYKEYKFKDLQPIFSGTGFIIHADKKNPVK
jgi:hypothetical protein